MLKVGFPMMGMSCGSINHIMEDRLFSSTRHFKHRASTIRMCVMS